MRRANWWPALGGAILVAVVAYFGFQALDASGMKTGTAAAVVTGKEHKDAAKTYRTDVIGGKTRVIPQYTPEMYILKLRVGDQDTEYASARDLFDSVGNGDRLRVTYEKRRLTGAIQVIRAEREVK